MSLGRPEPGDFDDGVDRSSIPYKRHLLVSTLVYHYRKDDSSCGCGWAELGRSHPMHVAEVYEMAAQEAP